VEVCHPEAVPSCLTRWREKCLARVALGVDRVFMLRFDRAMVAMSSQDFMKQYIIDSLKASHAVIGSHYLNGKADTALTRQVLCAPAMPRRYVIGGLVDGINGGRQ
jgi:riboflavin kinase/FMN adenylyltransferase